jgi:hypothetical protein
MDLDHTKCAIYKKKTGLYICHFAESTLFSSLYDCQERFHIKGTVSRDGFDFVKHVLLVLDLNRRRGQLLHILGAPMIS